MISSGIRALKELPAVALMLGALWLMRLRGQSPFDDATVAGVLPVRHYWNLFLRQHRQDIRGSALEIGNANMVKGFGGTAVTRTTVLDAVAGNGVDVVADLAHAWNVPNSCFDVFINQFSMHVIEDDLSALFHSVRILRPGGVLLVNFPCVSSYPADGLEYTPGKRSFVQRWYSPAGVRRMIDRLGLSEHATIETFGNDVGMMAYVHGISTRLLRHQWLAVSDPAVPILVCARITRPADWPAEWRPADAPRGTAGEAT